MYDFVLKQNIFLKRMDFWNVKLGFVKEMRIYKKLFFDSVCFMLFLICLYFNEYSDSGKSISDKKITVILQKFSAFFSEGIISVSHTLKISGDLFTLTKNL